MKTPAKIERRESSVLRKILLRGYELATQLNDPRRWIRLPRELQWYLRDLAAFRRAGGGGDAAMQYYPVLFQRTLNSPFDAHYTYQAIWATERIVRAAPARHYDVSSQIPFVAQLASFLPVTMFEFHAPDITLPNLTLREASLLDLPLETQSVMSISCLHVIEHVGLGRYGDPIDPEGMNRALKELARVVAVGGSLFLSVPVGRPQVAFNAHRIAAPSAILAVADAAGLELKEFALVDDRSKFHAVCDPSSAENLEYGCGMFWFVRPSAAH